MRLRCGIRVGVGAARVGGQLVVGERVGAFPHRLVRAGQVQLRATVFRARRDRVLIVTQRVSEVVGGEPIATLARRLVQHTFVASAGCRRGRAVGRTLILERFDLLFELIQLLLLLIELALIRLDRIAETSGEQQRDHDCEE